MSRAASHRARRGFGDREVGGTVSVAAKLVESGVGEVKTTYLPPAPATADAAAPARRKLGNTKWRKGLIPDQEFTYSFVAE